MQANIIDVSVREVIPAGRQADVDLAGQVAQLLVAVAIVGDHVVNCCSTPQSLWSHTYLYQPATRFNEWLSWELELAWWVNRLGFAVASACPVVHIFTLLAVLVFKVLSQGQAPCSVSLELPEPGH